MKETRHSFREELRALEGQTLGGIDLVAGQLASALDCVRRHDVELAGWVVADDERIDGRYLEVHQGVLSLLARQTPVAGDLRLVAALLHVIRCIERIGDQCANIAKLVPLCDEQAPGDPQTLDGIARMGELTHAQLLQAKEAFRTRNLALAHELALHDADIARMNRRIFDYVVAAGERPAVREWAMFMVLVARALERISANTVDIAEQTVFVVTAHLGALAPDPAPRAAPAT